MNAQFSSALGLVLLASTPALGLQRGGAQREQLFITCTPETVSAGRDGSQRVPNPIATALSMAGPGSRIELLPGDYPGFSIGFNTNDPHNARSAGGDRHSPVVVEARMGVRIVPKPNPGDTISIHQDVRNGHVTFRGLEIMPGTRAGIMFFKQGGGRTHDGYRFLDCHIRGNFDHVAKRGKRSRWGVWGHNMRDFEFRGERGRAVIEKIGDEHAFYIQNPRGDITIENVDARYLGRTFCQFTARKREGGPGVGNITIRNCKVEDVGLGGPWDGFKGGTAFTVAGRITGTILFERNIYRAGFDPRYRVLTKAPAPYGTGALVAWDGGEKESNGTLVLKDNDFEFAKGCGDRAVVSIGACRDVQIVGNNRFIAGGKEPALALDPVTRGQNPRLVNPPNGKVFVAPTTRVEGLLTVRGEEAPLASLSAPRKFKKRTPKTPEPEPTKEAEEAPPPPGARRD